MKIKNNLLAFTLVELIVVITILAILWTIAFINLQWYSTSARDSKRLSDINNIQKKIWIELSKWIPLSNLISTVKINQGLTIDSNTSATSIQWTAIFQALKEEWNNFKDPITKWDYILSYSIWWTWTWAYKFTQISTVNEEKNQAVVKWNYYKMHSWDSESITKDNNNIFVTNGWINLPYEINEITNNWTSLFDKLVTYIEWPWTYVYANKLVNSLIELNWKLYFFDTEDWLNSIDTNSNVININYSTWGKPFVFNNKIFYVWTWESGDFSYTDWNTITTIEMYVDNMWDYSKMKIFNNKLYFWWNNYNDNSDWYELYSIDTSNNLSYIDINIWPWNSKLSTASTFWIFNNKMYFWANNWSWTSKLFSLDSSETLTDLNITSSYSISWGNSSEFIAFNWRLYFLNSIWGIINDLFYIDSSENLYSVDINNWSWNAYPWSFNIFNNRLYFVANRNDIWNELFYIDSSNNLWFYDIESWVNSSWISGLYNHNNYMYFVWQDWWIQNNFKMDNTNTITSNIDLDNFSNILWIYENKLFFEWNNNNNRLNYIDSSWNTHNTLPINIPEES